MLINPNIHIGTAEAYAGIIPCTPEHSLKEILSDDVDQWKGLVKNDFEDSIFKNHPKIKELKARLYDEGADYAAMSGSGSTVFGLFQSKPQNWKFPDTYSVKIAQM